MLTLHLPEVMHALKHKPLFVLSPDNEAFVCDPRDKGRRGLVNRMLPLMHRAQKYIFDSGSDTDVETVKAVRDTTVNMLEAGLFHLPHPVMWIEDPFTDDPADLLRNYLLATEEKDCIRLHFIQRFAAHRAVIPPGMNPKHLPQFILHPQQFLIDLEQPSDLFMIENIKSASADYAKVSGEAVYSFKKLIVTLNTERLHVEKVSVGRTKGNWGGDPRTRPYDHTVVRVPFEAAARASGGHAAAGSGPRRRTLVAGYQWGKHTRPLVEQRWIKPFYRGDAEVGVVERDFYKVETHRA